MITVRPGRERGHANYGWLDTYHSFSFANYFDPAQMGFASLRVINEDRIAPGKGFDGHPHRDVEILTYLLAGELVHQDSMGDRSTLRTDEVQRLSAGTGALHSEHNPSPDQPAHFLQIWILPSRQGLPPSYEQKAFPRASKRGHLCLVASPDGRDDSLTIHQDASVYATVLDHQETACHPLAPVRRAYVHVATGEVLVNGMLLRAGDGARFSQETLIRLDGVMESEVLLFDMA